MPIEYHIGLMSGTSLDGVDAVLAGFGATPCRMLATSHIPFDSTLRDELLALNHAGDNELQRAALAGNELARCYAQAVSQLLNSTGIAPGQIAAIGCHGQTVRHRPELGFTLQIGNPALLAELTGITVIADFRARDIAAGGQGAPLVPAFHAAVFRHAQRHRVIINIGGIANLTDLPPGDAVAGFDCGPGNMLMDAWAMRHTGKPYDEDGAWADSGSVITGLLDKLLSEPFFRKPPPKSTGRDLFSLDWLQPFLSQSDAPQNVQATLLQLTAQGIADAVKHHCHGAEEIYLCGGGAKNKSLVRALQQRLAGASISLTNDLGIDAEWVEAFAFAWLSMQTLKGKPGNLPSVTGARHPCILGAIYPA